MDVFKYRKTIVLIIGLIALASVYFSTQVRFVFDFERFFPQGDEDLNYFNEFKEEFEDDDNFLLVAFSDPVSIFNQDLLVRVDSFTRLCSTWEYVVDVQSITNFKYFVKFPLGGFSPPYPAIKLDRPERLPRDSSKVMQDERIVGNLISKNGKSTVVFIKTKNRLSLEESNVLMENIKTFLSDTPPDEYHILGRAYFQNELVQQQIKEFILNTVMAALLVCLVLWFILRRFWGVIIAMISMGLCLLIFMGLIGLFDIELDMLSSLFPIVMIIVGVSDVVHLTSKYIDEYEKTGERKLAIQTAVREIGLATFLTSFTTAIGFLTLMTSRIYPVKSFGFTAAMGVIAAFLVVITFTSAFLALMPAHKIIRTDRANFKWRQYLNQFYSWTRYKSKAVGIGAMIYLVFCFLGIIQISTDIRIYDTLPRDIKITNDFRYFEENYAGFRPIEIGLTIKSPYTATDYPVLNEINKIEEYLKATGNIEGITSITAIYKTLNRALKADRAEGYLFPETKQAFDNMSKYVEKLPKNELNVLLNKDQTKARITSKVKDVGSERINAMIEDIELFTKNEIDTNIVTSRITGTGVIVDKNNEYLRRSLLGGLAMAFLAISFIMALLFKNIKMVFISLVPNIFPLLFGGALMGYFNIALDAPTAIIFAISFGIAVDDTIHFLSKFKLERLKGKSIEDSLRVTIVETGKAIIITSIILFFGFLILLFSKTFSVVAVGLLVSGTLISAVAADLLLIPALIRYFLKDSLD
jgi:predicted RND superfamily exporter protein